MKKATESVTKQHPFQTRFNRWKFPVLDTGPVGLTKQSFKDECDINSIMEKFNRTGQLPDMIKTNPKYGDFTSVPNYQESLNTVIHANEQFAGLSAKVRDRFNNDPEKFLQFVNKKENLSEMISLGIAVARNDDPNDKTPGTNHKDLSKSTPPTKKEEKTDHEKS